MCHHENTYEQEIEILQKQLISVINDLAKTTTKENKQESQKIQKDIAQIEQMVHSLGYPITIQHDTLD